MKDKVTLIIAMVSVVISCLSYLQSKKAVDFANKEFEISEKKYNAKKALIYKIDRIENGAMYLGVTGDISQISRCIMFFPTSLITDNKNMGFGCSHSNDNTTYSVTFESEIRKGLEKSFEKIAAAKNHSMIYKVPLIITAEYVAMGEAQHNHSLIIWKQKYLLLLEELQK